MSITVVGSPPYESQVIRARDIGKPGFLQGATQGAHSCDAYGSSPGQLGALPPGSLDASSVAAPSAPVTIWQGCYNDGWQDLILPEAFAHPAKFARGLIHRIYRHLLEQGYVRQGGVVLDCFGGVALGALDAMTYGLRYVGVELEPRFVALGQQNLDLWRQRYGFTGGTIVQGDSRRLREVLAGAQVGCVVGSPPFQGCHANGVGVEAHGRQVTAERVQSRIGYGTTPGQLGAMPPGQVGCVVGSPPYATETPRNDQDYAVEKLRQKQADGVTASRATWGHNAGSAGQQGYGRTTPGQLGAMPPGALVSSPPYAGAGEVLGTHNGIDWSKAQEGGKVATPARQASGEGYGTSAGQLGAMPPGVVVSSPPYAVETIHAHNTEQEMQRLQTKLARGQLGGRESIRVAQQGTFNPHANSVLQDYGTTPGQLGAMPPGCVVSSPPWDQSLGGGNGTAANHDWFTTREKVFAHGRGGRAGQSLNTDYGTTPGQLGAEPDTFWSASAQIMAELSALLPPGAVCAWVLKAYVSKKAIVPFPDQWRALCEAHGFVLVEEIHASLVEDHGTQEGLFGEAQRVTTEKKSFFRRLAEKKGSPRIDHETVLIVRKAGGPEGGVCCVSSPPYAESEQNYEEGWKHIAQEANRVQRRGAQRDATYGTTPGNLGNMPVGRRE